MVDAASVNSDAGSIGNDYFCVNSDAGSVGNDYFCVNSDAGSIGNDYFCVASRSGAWEREKRYVYGSFDLPFPAHKNFSCLVAAE